MKGQDGTKVMELGSLQPKKRGESTVQGKQNGLASKREGKNKRRNVLFGRREKKMYMT